MFKIKKIYVSLIMLLTVGFVINILATDSFAQKDSKKKRLKISLKLAKERERDQGKNLYKIIQMDGKLFGEATEVEDPVTGDPLDGEFKLEYQCKVDALIQSTRVKIVDGESDRWEFLCDGLTMAQLKEGLPVTLTVP